MGASQLPQATPSGTTGLAAGTSFPGSPATNTQFFRTDRGLAYYWDGTRWLTMHLYAQSFSQNGVVLPTSVADVYHQIVPWVDYDQWLVDYHLHIRVATTNNGTNFWSALLRKVDLTAAAVTTISTLTTAAEAPNNFVRLKAPINALLGTTWTRIDVSYTKTGSPGTMSSAPMLTYRLVG